MRKYCTTIKNKAYIFLEVIIISFLFISLTLFVQILLNNSFKLYKIDYETQENFQNLDFLNEIVKEDTTIIEKPFYISSEQDNVGVDVTFTYTISQNEVIYT